jgi:hypothetical protein
MVWDKANQTAVRMKFMRIKVSANSLIAVDEHVTFKGSESIIPDKRSCHWQLHTFQCDHVLSF